MKNFNLLYLWLVIIFVSTEAAPRFERLWYGGYYGGSGGGELPDWAIILICVVSVGFIAFVLYACCIEEDYFGPKAIM